MVERARAPSTTGIADLPAPVLLEEQQAYTEFATALQETCLIGDPWYEGEPIYYSAPLVLAPEFLGELYGAAEKIGKVYEELVQIVTEAPDLLDSFFGLPPFYKLMFLSSDGWWHGFARMDMFLLTDGTLKICELNSDTPSGQVETLVPAGLVAPRYPQYDDPNRFYEERFWDVMCRYHQNRTGDDSTPKTVGIIYPTDLSEDITLIRLYQQWLEKRGVSAPLGSPYNLHPTGDGGVGLFGEKLDVVLRHYKTDWWGERPRIWTNEEELADPDPLDDELLLLLEAERKGHVSVVNPFGAVVPQNKLSLAFFWEEMARFSDEGRAIIKELIPETYRLDTVGRDVVKAERAAWVMKSDYGCEGDEVLIGPTQDVRHWEESVDVAMEGAWIVQRYFDIAPLPSGKLPNYGIYLIGGAPSGLLVRLAEPGVEEDAGARVVPPLVGRVD